jgi:hypothetical protein
MPQVLHFLGSGRDLSGLILRPGLKLLLLLKKGLQLGLSVLELGLSAREFGNGQIAVATSTVMKHLSGEGRLLLRAMSVL